MDDRVLHDKLKTSLCRVGKPSIHVPSMALNCNGCTIKYAVNSHAHAHT